MSDTPSTPRRFGVSTENDDSVLHDAPDNPIDRVKAGFDDAEADLSRRQSSTGQGQGKMPSSAGDAAQKGQEALGTAKDKAGEMKDKAGQVTEQAHSKADQGMHKAGDTVSQAAEMLRERGEQQGGSMGSAATTAANTLDSASSYLKEKDTDQLLQDIEALIRKKPVESLLVAAGAGFVLSKILG